MEGREGIRRSERQDSGSTGVTRTTSRSSSAGFETVRPRITHPYPEEATDFGMAALESDRCKIMHNVCIVSLVFLLYFTAFRGMQSLQTSVEVTDPHLTTRCVYAGFASLGFSALFIPSLAINRLGCKWTMVISTVPYILFMAANLYPTWWTLLPTTVLMGLAGAPLWVAKSVYVTSLARSYAYIAAENNDVIINRFFGIFFMAFQSSQIWSSLVSSFILEGMPENATLWFVSDSELELCGSLHCKHENISTQAKQGRPSSIKVFSLFGAYIALGILALLILSLLLDKLEDNPQPGSPRPSMVDDLAYEIDERQARRQAGRQAGRLSLSEEKDGIDNLGLDDSLKTFQLRELSYRSDPSSLDMNAYLGDDDDIWYSNAELTPSATPKGTCPGCLSCSQICRLLFATFHHLGNSNQLLLIPITVYSGLEQAFLASDFTETYVRCALGVWAVGLVLLCFGVTNTFCSFFFGRIVKYTGRLSILALGALIHCGCQVYLFLWQPHPDVLWIFFLLTGLWGMADAIWQTLINVLYGSVFEGESAAAFSNYRLWQIAGFVAAFLSRDYLCVYVKLMVLLGTLSVGMMGYLVVEYKYRMSGAHTFHNGQSRL